MQKSGYNENIDRIYPSYAKTPIISPEANRLHSNIIITSPKSIIN